MPLFLAHMISALIVIPLVTHGITRISTFQLFTQPIWAILQLGGVDVILDSLRGADLDPWALGAGATGLSLELKYSEINPHKLLRDLS